jgi:nitrogen regulatory protein P-II 2
MVQLETIRRITIYAGSELEASLLTRFKALGAKGYTITESRGLGEHGTLDDPMARSTHVRIELLVQPAVADTIMDYLGQLHAQHRPVAACVESVQVSDPKHF